MLSLSFSSSSSFPLHPPPSISYLPITFRINYKICLKVFLEIHTVQALLFFRENEIITIVIHFFEETSPLKNYTISIWSIMRNLFLVFEKNDHLAFTQIAYIALDFNCRFFNFHTFTCPTPITNKASFLSSWDIQQGYVYALLSAAHQK